MHGLAIAFGPRLVVLALPCVLLGAMGCQSSSGQDGRDSNGGSNANASSGGGGSSVAGGSGNSTRSPSAGDASGGAGSTRGAGTGTNGTGANGTGANGTGTNGTGANGTGANGTGGRKNGDAANRGGDPSAAEGGASRAGGGADKSGGGKDGNAGESGTKADGGGGRSPEADALPDAASGPGGGNSGKGGSSGTTSDSATSAAVPSTGCGSASPLKSSSGRATIDVGGTKREYILKVPDGYDTDHPYRLVFGWHGMQYDAEWVANGESPLTGPYFGIESEAKGDAVFVAPQALSGGWTNDGGRDIAFLEEMLRTLEAQLCIDKARVFSTGFSFGAIMTITIGCTESGAIRAVAPMSGSLKNGCPDGSPVAYWASHGDSDPTIKISDGEKARDQFVKRNHCQSKTVNMAREGCVGFQGCDEGYPVNWCVFSGVHEPAPFAGPAIWEFLSQF